MTSSPDSLSTAPAPLFGPLPGDQNQSHSPFMPPATPAPSLLAGSPPSPSKSSTAVVEKHYRSFLKAISWRATGTLDTILISFLITGKIKLAVSIGFVEVFTKIGLFYLHERLWNKIALGRARAQEDYTI